MVHQHFGHQHFLIVLQILFVKLHLDEHLIADYNVVTISL